MRSAIAETATDTRRIVDDIEDTVLDSFEGGTVGAIDAVEETRLPLGSVLEVVGAAGGVGLELVAVVRVLEEFVEGELGVKVDDDGGVVSDEAEGLLHVCLGEAQCLGSADQRGPLGLGLDAALVDDVGDGSSLEVREDVEGLDLTQCRHKAHDRVKQHPLDLPFGLLFLPPDLLFFFFFFSFVLGRRSFDGHQSRLQITFFNEAASYFFSSSSFFVFVFVFAVFQLPLFNAFHSTGLALVRVIRDEVGVVGIISVVVAAKVVKVIIIREGLRAIGGRGRDGVFLLADPLVEEDVEGGLVVGAEDGELGFELRAVREAPES